MSLKFDPNIQAAPIFAGGKAAEDYGPEALKLHYNESPLGPSPLAVAAIQKAAANLNRYPPIGDDDLRAALVEAFGEGWTPEHFITGNGGSDVLEIVAKGFINPGDECILCRPTFPIYERTARRAGAEIVYADLDPEDFTYDVEAILAAITPRTSLVYLCNPNNPTGTLLTAGQMETLMDNIPDHVLVVSDEVYHSFADPAIFPHSLNYIRQGKNLFITHSFSKAYSLAGLRLGYGISTPEINHYLARLRGPFHLSELVLAGGLAALQDRAYMQKTVELVVQGRQWLYQQLTNLGVQTWPSQTNFLLFKPPLPAGEVAGRFLQQGIVVRPMAGFYLPDHMRVTVGLQEENERFISTLKEILAER
jgi:histidinol-phosphate aminotransferase